MRIVRDWRGLSDADRGAAVAVGAFDGVHRGHQAVVAEARAAAERLGVPLGVVSFDPHPRRWFQPEAAPFRLMTPDQMAEALAPAGETSHSHEVAGSACSDAGVHDGHGLAYLQNTARERRNVFAALIEAVKTHSLGQISHALYDVGGEYRRNM